jgi:hypothetical protein
MTPSSEHLTGIARAIPDHAVGIALARQRIASHRTDEPVAPYADCVKVGRAAGMSMTEIQRAGGTARQTPYNALRSVDGAPPRTPPTAQLRDEVLAILTAQRAYGNPLALAEAAKLDKRLVMGALIELGDREQARIYRDSDGSITAEPTDETYKLVRHSFDRLYLRRPDSTSVYLEIPKGHTDAVRDAVAELSPGTEATIITRDTVPSRMRGDELAFVTPAPTYREAAQLAQDFWAPIAKRVGLPDVAIIADILLPGSRTIFASDVLDAFMTGILDEEAPRPETLVRARDAFLGDVDERTLALRCASEAARALRACAGNTGRPALLRTGDDAFAELESVNAVATEYRIAQTVDLDARFDAVREATVKALLTAVDRIGPLAGGRLGGGGDTGEVKPSREDLATIATAAGHAVGGASRLTAFSVLDAMQRVISGTDKPVSA